ncbi:MAG: TrbI/VirB10 family protein [Alphaproteobacteria bacterium]
MNNDDQNPENDEIEMDDGTSFDEFEEKDKTLGTLLNDNPMLKVGVVVGVVVIVFIAIITLGKKEDPLDQSHIGAGSDISAPPGTEQLTQDYVDAVQEVNERNVEIAQQTGGSALPTPIEPPVGVLSVPAPEIQEEDPLERWRRLQEERLERELEQTQAVAPATPEIDTGRGEMVQALAELFSQQMQGVLDSKQNTLTHRPVTSADTFAEENAGDDEAQDSTAQEGSEEIVQNILVPAGQIAYAQLLIEANTDAPGPVLAQIASGPLKGSRILGSFEAQDDVLTLSFNTVVINGVSQSIDAVALDPATSLPGLATEVDNRYLSRVLLPAAAAFVEGAAEAIAESGRTTITIQGETVSEETEEPDSEEEIASGIEEAGQEIRTLIDEETQAIEKMIRIAAGTPMGILFLAPVVEEN